MAEDGLSSTPSGPPEPVVRVGRTNYPPRDRNRTPTSDSEVMPDWLHCWSTRLSPARETRWPRRSNSSRSLRRRIGTPDAARMSSSTGRTPGGSPGIVGTGGSPIRTPKAGRVVLSRANWYSASRRIAVAFPLTGASVSRRRVLGKGLQAGQGGGAPKGRPFAGRYEHRFRCGETAPSAPQVHVGRRGRTFRNPTSRSDPA